MHPTDVTEAGRSLAELPPLVPWHRPPGLFRQAFTRITARLAQRLTLVPTTTTIPPPTGVVVNRPDGGAPVRVSERR